MGISFFDAADALVQAEVAAEVAARAQLSLGVLAAKLETLDPDLPILAELGGSLFPAAGLASYRGYYDHLMVEVEPGGENTVGRLLTDAKAAHGAVFIGYKGGDFKMSTFTPIWVDMYSCTSGHAAIDVVVRDGAVVIVTEATDA